MPDFNIDVGFDTRGFQGLGGNGNQVGGVDAGVSDGPSAGKGLGGFGQGMVTALKASGLLALLLNLKVIVDLLGGILAILNLVVILYIKGIFEFFKERPFLKMGIFLANAFLMAVESLGNLLVPGEPFELGRFRADVIGEDLDAGASLFEALQKGFMTEEEYQKNRIAKSLLETKKLEDAHRAELRNNDLRAQLANEFSDEINMTLNPAVTEGSNAFLEFWRNFINEIDKMNEAVTGGATKGGVAFLQSITGGPLSPSQVLGASRLQSSSVTDKDARAYNYLTGLNR